MSTDVHNFGRHTLLERLHITNPSNAFCVTGLPCEILLAILVMFFTAEYVTVLFWQYLCHFFKFQYYRYLMIMLTSFVSADV